MEVLRKNWNKKDTFTQKQTEATKISWTHIKEKTWRI